MRLITKSAAVLIFMGVSSASALADTDGDALAGRFLYCANVYDFFYKYLSKHEPTSKGLNGYREGKNVFWLAAATASHGDFLIREKDSATQRVVDVLEQEKREKSNLMDAEARSCLASLQNDAIPLLQKSHGSGKTE
ncbi:hypothetical protein [Duganella hordei]|uniref:hypothetical protein n=1 Tax=Duganella hordei TaxID=2865934 RepID=UPI0030E7D227